MYSFLPYGRNPFFTGRERTLIEIATLFTTRVSELRIVEIVGMPGSGKTETALEYAYRYHQQYQAVIWLLASSYHQLAENIAELFGTFGIRLAWRTDDERAVVFERFRWWLRQYSSGVLLILDHCDQYNLVNVVLGEDVIGHVLITNDALGTVDADETKTVLVKPFDGAESILFLLRRTGLLALHQPLQSVPRSARHAALAIHKEFDGHPLALDQAGAYISETGIHLAEYLPLYQQDRRAFLSRRGTASASHPLAAYAVIAAMRRRGAYDAEKLLMLYVHGKLDRSNPYPRLPATLLHDLDLDQADLLEMRHTLIRYFLLLPLRRTYGIHLLVQTVMRDVWAAEKVEKQRWQQEAAEYEPLDENGIVQILAGVQQMKKQQAAFEKNDPDAISLARRINTTVIRLKRAVLLGDVERREVQKSKIESFYADLITGKDTPPLFRASQHDVRRYAQELLALMEYRE